MHLYNSHCCWQFLLLPHVSKFNVYLPADTSTSARTYRSNNYHLYSFNVLQFDGHQASRVEVNIFAKSQTHRTKSNKIFLLIFIIWSFDTRIGLFFVIDFLWQEKTSNSEKFITAHMYRTSRYTILRLRKRENYFSFVLLFY